MPLDNYRDLSTTGSGSGMGAGFQFEFFCGHCGSTWKTPFKPYRPGQISNFVSLFASFLPGRMNLAARAGHAFTDARSVKAREAALLAGMQRAETLYQVCRSCQRATCDNCWDSGQSICTDCAGRQATDLKQAARAANAVCPNCQTPNEGGRFCAECGFDMASTHKTCPGCGAMQSRQSRFCTDCGHSF